MATHSQRITRTAVVFANRRAQQQRLLLVETHAEPRKMPALGVKQAELGEAQIFDVTIAVQNGKGIAAFEHTSTIVHQCGRRADVIFVGNPDNVRQKTEPSCFAYCVRNVSTSDVSTERARMFSIDSYSLT